MFSTFTASNLDFPIELKFVKIESPRVANQNEVADDNGNKRSVRSRYGCLTCRKKKKKCDETRPVCGLCLKKNHDCVWRLPGTERRNKRLKRSRKNEMEEEEDDDDDEDRFNEFNATSLEMISIPLFNAGVNEEQVRNTEEITKLTPSPSALISFQDHIAKSPSFLLGLQDILNPAFEAGKIQDVTPKDERDSATLSSLPHTMMDSPSWITDFYLKYYNSPQILSSPSDSLTKELDDQAICYLDYYRTCVATTVSIAPVESNYFLNFYIPMANVEKSVLFAIIGWGGMFMTGSKDNVAYSYYIKSSIDLCKEKLKSKSLTQNEILTLLTTLTILLLAEVCVGDVKQWYVFFEEIYRIIKTYGLKNLVNDYGHPNELRWLVLNFLYHDVLLSRSLKNGTFFKPIEYQELLQYDDHVEESPKNNNSFSLGLSDANCGADPLQGYVRPLYMIIAEIINCSVEIKESLKKWDQDELKEVEEFESMEDSNYMFTNFHCISIKQKKYELYNKIESEFQRIDSKIISSKPNNIALSYLDNDSDLELHLTLFETFQLTAQIYLRMLVLQRSPCATDMQRLLYNLTNCIDILIGSKVQASLCFPLLVAGLQCISKLDRIIMLKRFDHMVSHFPVMNFKLVKEILEKAWLRNIDGQACVDWSRIADELGWDLCVS